MHETDLKKNQQRLTEYSMKDEHSSVQSEWDLQEASFLMSKEIIVFAFIWKGLQFLTFQEKVSIPGNIFLSRSLTGSLI